MEKIYIQFRDSVDPISYNYEINISDDINFTEEHKKRILNKAEELKESIKKELNDNYEKRNKETNSDIDYWDNEELISIVLFKLNVFINKTLGTKDREYIENVNYDYDSIIYI